VSFEGHYSPDLMSQYALGYIEDAASRIQPFFIAVAPIAPHSTLKAGEYRQFGIPEYAKRQAGMFSNYKIPRTENFNPDVLSGVSWVRELPKLNQTLIDYHDEFQRARLRSLQSVDETIDSLVNSLQEKDLLDNTYIIYTTDNGFHISQHRLPPGKECPFEEDINIPLMIRGPGVPVGGIANVVSSHTDLTPTILELAGSDRPDLDGSLIPLDVNSLSSLKSGEHVNVEFWGEALLEGKYNSPFDEPEDTSNNTYKALRVIGGDYNVLYTVWCNGEREFYDVARDRSQMHNYHDSKHTPSQTHYGLLGRSFKHIMNRLDALLMVTKSCRGWECHEPWRVLHLDGSVVTLADALHESYDAFYEGQPRVSFSSCLKGHIISEEGPQDVTPWQIDGSVMVEGVQGLLLPGTARKASFERNGRWSDWT
jgi:N-acetylglucosamine-6-sulfatase